MEYFRLGNLIDLTYIVLNFVVLILYFFDDETSLDTLRTIAAISYCALWLRVFEWLRLFDSTAFFIKLIVMTFDYITYFMIIMIVWYMMFYSALDILNIGNQN